MVENYFYMDLSFLLTTHNLSIFRIVMQKLCFKLFHMQIVVIWSNDTICYMCFPNNFSNLKIIVCSYIYVLMYM